ncbi:uncharacterized protein lrrfip1a isoform X4 [Alosa sapidissima]|uniref:uncharacterized protein lrrfip1a isoform X4 n=1 Tax=Alosa sapidissima TaxID=34773 RepID=UPI001C092D6A|nr:uncharacterized protein lrrfip1a isoform X4 [Alosa sapidissima]
MGTQGPGRKRIPNKERLTAEDDALNVIAREAEARLAAKRAARAEAREIRMKELERQQKEIYQVQKKYYGLDNKWGDIEQWMEDSERYSRHTRRHASNSDDEERMSVSSRGSVRSDLDAVGAYGGLGSERGSTSHSHKKSKKKKKKHSKASNGCDDDCSTVSGWSSKLSDESRHTRSSKLDLQPGSYRSSDLYGNSSLPSSRLQTSSYNGHQLSLLHDTTNYVRKRRGSLYEDSIYSSASSRRYTGSAARVPSEYSGFLGSSSRTSSRASSACASPVEDCGGSVASFLRSAANTSSLPRDLDHVTIPDLSDVSGRVDDRLDRDYLEKGSRASTISSATLASLGGTSSRRGSGDTSITADTETSIREIKDTLTEMEEKYRKAMVSNAQLDNDKCNLMYQVDIQKDSLMELEELLFETRREYDEKAKELEREKHAHSILQFQFSELKQTLKQSEELLTEIRQLNLQRDGYVREVADLQETLEWKDKKIGALERQKEYSDAIRNERDELRDEVVQLKDILKKHGIVLGPDFSTNGEAGESGDGTGQADSDTKTSPTEGSSVLGRSEEKQPGVLEAAEGLQPNQLDEAVPQNHVTPPSPSGPASVVETCQSVEPGAPPIGNKEEIESGNTINTELNNTCSDTVESVQLASVVSAGAEDEVTREEKVSLEASGSSVERCKPPGEVKEMGNSEIEGLDPMTENQLVQKVEEVCAGEPTAEISEEVEEIRVTEKSENANVIGAGKGTLTVPEIIVSIDTSDQSEEKPLEGAADLSSSCTVVAEEEASHPPKTVAEAEAAPVSEEEAEASQTPSKEPHGTSASGKKKKRKRKNKQKQKVGAHSEQDNKHSKAQGESSLSKDPGQETGKENLGGKAVGSCVESIQQSPVCGEADSTANERPLTDTKEDAASEELGNVPCLQASDNKDDIKDEPAPVSGGDCPTKTSEAHPNPESENREHPSSDLEQQPPVCDETDSTADMRPLTDTKEDAASEELENVPCLQASDNKDDIRDEPTQVTGGDCPNETPEAHPNPESDDREHPSSDLESGPNTDSVPGGPDCSPDDEDLIDGTETLCADKDASSPKVTGDEQNEEVVQPKNIDEQENTEISVDVSESIVNTDVSESCQDQQVQVEGLPCDTPIDAQLTIDTETQLTESKLNVEHHALGDLSEDTHASDSLDKELVEEKPEGSLLMHSSDAPSQLDGSESTETDQAESTLHSTENATSQDDTTESLPVTGGNGTETQLDKAEEATEAYVQSGEVVQPMASTDEESEPVIQDQPVATAPSDDFKDHPREGSPETNDATPKSKAEDAEEDEEGEEFEFEDQDLELLPDSPRQPLTEETEEDRCSKVEVDEEHEGYQGQDQENSGSQEQSSVTQQEGGGADEDEELETRQEPNVTGGEAGSAGEEPKAEEADQVESSGMDHIPANPEHPLSSTEVEAEAAENKEVGSISGDSEGAGQVAEVEPGQQGEPTRKDSKKGKKNKGKGKEDCKMS